MLSYLKQGMVWITQNWKWGQKGGEVEAVEDMWSQYRSPEWSTWWFWSSTLQRSFPPIERGYLSAWWGDTGCNYTGDGEHPQIKSRLVGRQNILHDTSALAGNQRTWEGNKMHTQCLSDTFKVVNSWSNCRVVAYVQTKRVGQREINHHSMEWAGGETVMDEHELWHPIRQATNTSYSGEEFRGGCSFNN